MISENDEILLRNLYEKSKGKAWEPRDPSSKFLKRMVDAGYLRRVDGRCGFERFKDSHIAWTELGLKEMQEPIKRLDFVLKYS